MQEIAAAHTADAQQQILDQATSDHGYCSNTSRPASSSDSGICPDGSLSPGHLSDSLSMGDVDSRSVFSGGHSPVQYEDTPHGSPLDTNVEDLQLGDINVDKLYDFFSGLPDIALDLSKSYILYWIKMCRFN